MLYTDGTGGSRYWYDNSTTSTATAGTYYISPTVTTSTTTIATWTHIWWDGTITVGTSLYNYRLPVRHELLGRSTPTPQTLRDPTPEELRAQARRQRETEERQRRYAELDARRAVENETVTARRRAAKDRAKNLLMRQLTPEQRESFDSHGFFVVRGGHSGRKYRIRLNGESLVANVDLLMADNDNQVETRLCAHPCLSHGIPIFDHLIAQKVSIEWDEQRFLAVANRH